jgi:hypothetical protein
MKKELQELLVQGMAKRQNSVKKLNAGQLREAAKVVADTLLQDFTAEQKLMVIKLLSK